MNCFLRTFVTIALGIALASCAAPIRENDESVPPPASALPITRVVAAEPGVPASAAPVSGQIPAETAAATPDLWRRIRSGFQLVHRADEPRVQAELDWYLRHPAYLDRVFSRAARYLHFIATEVETRGMPMEFALLPVVESAFDPFAYSHGRAMGLWQFIPATARLYDLRMDWWYDGRRDVQASTRAALDYLQALHKSLDGDWLLALAAYNSGEGNIRKAQAANRRRGMPMDFWSLKLLRETSAYVPRLLAISHLVANSDKLKVTLKPLADKPYWQQVNFDSQLDLAKAAELAGMASEELYTLNPAFNQWATHPDGPHHLLIPVSKSDQFSDSLAALPRQQRVAWQRHRIEPGESLGVIAKRYGTSVSTLRQVNAIRGNLIRAGDSLLIPIPAFPAADYSLSALGRQQDRHQYLERKYGGSPIKYTVRPGDSFWDISLAHGIGYRELARWNGMAPSELLIPGMELVIYRTKSLAVPLIPDTSVIRKVNYRVRQGESLSVIAKKFNLSVSKIRNWNQDLKSRKYIHPGQRITLYVDVTQAE